MNQQFSLSIYHVLHAQVTYTTCQTHISISVLDRLLHSACAPTYVFRKDHRNVLLRHVQSIKINLCCVYDIDDAYH